MRSSNKLFVVTREAALAAPQKTKASLKKREAEEEWGKKKRR